ENSLGINWTAFTENLFEVGNFTISGASAPGSISQSIPYKPTLYTPGSTDSSDEETPFTLTIFHENINAVLKALANNYDTNLLSAPRVTTVNNRQAEIKIIEKLPWAEPEVEMNDTGGIAVTWNINFEEVGIILKVTPIITEDGNISMELEPEVSEKVSDYSLTVIQGTTQIPYTVPVIDTRKANTKVVIGNKQTLIIGGLIKEKNIKGATKIPLLGDLPLLGYFFKSKKDTHDKTELLIFVSATVITTAEMSRMAKKEKGVGKWYMDEGKVYQEKPLDQEKEANKAKSPSRQEKKLNQKEEASRQDGEKKETEDQKEGKKESKKEAVPKENKETKDSQKAVDSKQEEKKKDNLNKGIWEKGVWRKGD
ncbi:MAG: type II and III secretion system protein, partial [Candidatus Omnitrophota bacterium]